MWERVCIGMNIINVTVTHIGLVFWKCRDDGRVSTA
jgi:hypothetical protein